MTAARPKSVSAREPRDLIVEGGGLAFLDLRGEGTFGAAGEGGKR